MVTLTSPASTVLRACARQQLPAIRAASVTGQRRNRASVIERSAGEYDRTPTYDSPFRNPDVSPSTKIPSFKNYMSKKSETSNKTFQYFMVGSMGLLAAAGAKATVEGGSIYQHSELFRISGTHIGDDRVFSSSVADVGLLDFLVNMSASADVLAQAKVEIDLSAIPEGKNVCLIMANGWKNPSVTILGHHQMAGEARFHPPPHCG